MKLAMEASGTCSIPVLQSLSLLVLGLATLSITSNALFPCLSPQGTVMAGAYVHSSQIAENLTISEQQAKAKKTLHVFTHSSIHSLSCRYFKVT